MLSLVWRVVRLSDFGASLSLQIDSVSLCASAEEFPDGKTTRGKSSGSHCRGIADQLSADLPHNSLLPPPFLMVFLRA